ncbi:MAG: redox-sensing transcriptional repressor Rex [Dehalococcoidia bacterium]
MKIPLVVIDRLPLYARALAALESQGRFVVSSRDLGEAVEVSDAQIRKDLAYFGRFGKQGRGYDVQKLLDELRRILGLNRQWRMVLVGTGRLGRAILGYEGFAPQGFRITHAFDSDPAMVGTDIGGLTVHNTTEIEALLAEASVDIGIVAVPAETAQSVIDRLVQCGIKAILNYTPVTAHVPADVQMKRIDPVLSLQGMTYHLKAAVGPA